MFSLKNKLKCMTGRQATCAICSVSYSLVCTWANAYFFDLIMNFQCIESIHFQRKKNVQKMFYNHSAIAEVIYSQKYFQKDYVMYKRKLKEKIFFHQNSFSTNVIFSYFNIIVQRQCQRHQIKTSFSKHQW